MKDSNKVTLGQLKKLISESTNASIIISSPYKSVESLKSELKRKGYDLINVTIWGGGDVQLRGDVSQIIGALEEIWRYSETEIFDKYPELNSKPNSKFKYDQSAYGPFEYGDNMLETAFDNILDRIPPEYEKNKFGVGLAWFWDEIEELCDNDNLDFDQVKINLFIEYDDKKEDYFDEDFLSIDNRYLKIPKGIENFFKEEIAYLNESLFVEDEEDDEGQSDKPNFTGRKLNTILKKRLFNVFGKLTDIQIENSSTRINAIKPVNDTTVYIAANSLEILPKAFDKSLGSYPICNKAEVVILRNKQNKDIIRFEMNVRDFSRTTTYVIGVILNKCNIKIDSNMTLVTCEAFCNRSLDGIKWEYLTPRDDLHKPITLTFKGNIFERVPAKTLRLENFKNELKSVLINAIEKEFKGSDVDNLSYSINAETKTMNIKFSCYGNTSGDGWSYSGESKMKYYGGRWRLERYWVEDSESAPRLMHVEEFVKDVSLAISGAMISTFEKYGQKVPRFLNISYYSEYD
jgi:hypothetical protein